MKATHAIGLTVALLTTVTVANAADKKPSTADCLQVWQELDKDANGVLSRQEDSKAVDNLRKLEGQVPTASITRDEYISICVGKPVGGATANVRGEQTTPPSKPAGPENASKLSEGDALAPTGGAGSTELPHDLGKGDLTVGKSPFDAEKAAKRLEALGFKDTQNLVLGSDGIWRGTAQRGVDRVSVALDPQGDVVAAK